MATILMPPWRKERVLDGPYSKEIQRIHMVAASAGDGTILFMEGLYDKGFNRGEVYELRRSSENVANERQSELITWSIQPVETRTPGAKCRYGNACVLFSKMFVIYGGCREFCTIDAVFALDLGKYISMHQRRHKTHVALHRSARMVKVLPRVNTASDTSTYHESR